MEEIQLEQNIEPSENAPSLAEGTAVDAALKQNTPTNNENAILIDVKNVTMRYRTYSKRYDTLKELFVGRMHGRLKPKNYLCLDNISFTIRKGERVAIFGRNGAGKSTLLKIISGILTPTSGSVTLGGKITPLLQLGAGFDGNDTGYNNIYLNGAIMGYTKQQLKEKEQEIIDFAELGEFLHEPIKNYSSGMLGRLGFSIAMSMKPDIILIDEIMAVGDGAFRKKCNKKFDELISGGTTLVLVTHSTNISSTCDRGIWIKDKKIEMDADIQTVSDAYSQFLATQS